MKPTKKKSTEETSMGMSPSFVLVTELLGTPVSAEPQTVIVEKTGKFAHAFETWMSRGLDVYKGIFIIFMLTEHTRSALGMNMTPAEPIMQFVSQVACALDMTSFSTAYGFSCYRAYLTNSKERSYKQQAIRIFRSVGLTVAAAWLCNISFEMAVLRNPPTWRALRRILTFEVLYWDFLTTFPAMLLTGFFITKPFMLIASRSTSLVKRMVVFVILLGLPLLAASLALETCPSVSERYWAIFAGCLKRSMGAMRFSAFTYMFYFNFGCIVSMLTLEFSKSGASFPSIPQLLRNPYWIAFIALFSVEFYYALPVFGNYKTSWEYFNWNGYRRFPMTAPLVLAWGFMSQSVWIIALALTALVSPFTKLPSLVKTVVGKFISILESFGANVLLYLTVSNLVIHGFFHVDWSEFQGAATKKTSNRRGPGPMSIRTWEYIVLATALGQILMVQLITYLVRSSRK